MWLDLGVMKKFRFSESTDNGLFTLLSKQGFDLTRLARKIDRTPPGFRKMLKGHTSRYDEDVLRKLADEIGMLYARDEHGVFFYDPDEEGRVIADLDKDLQKLIQLWDDLPAEKRMKYLRLIQLLD